MSTQGPAAFYGVSIALTILDIVAVYARFYARRKQKQPFKIDDWLVLPALVGDIHNTVPSSSSLIRLGLQHWHLCRRLDRYGLTYRHENETLC